MPIQRISIGLNNNPFPDDNGRLCYFKSHEAIVFEKQTYINLLEDQMEKLENEIRNLRASQSCGCKSG